MFSSEVAKRLGERPTSTSNMPRQVASDKPTLSVADIQPAQTPAPRAPPRSTARVPASTEQITGTDTCG